MKASASLGVQSVDGTSLAVMPMVLVDGVVEPRLAVVFLRMTGPLDEREVRLLALDAVNDPTLAQRWIHRDVIIALPHRLNDETVRWSVLTQGRPRRFERSMAQGVEQHHLIVRDQWAEMMARPLTTIWWTNHESALLPLDHGELVPGPSGNRSSATFTVGHRRAHVLDADGEPWTVGSALTTLAAFADLGLSLRLLPPRVRHAPLLAPVDLAQPVGEALRRVLEPYGLTVRRELWRDGATVIESRHVRMLQHGRPIRLRWADHGSPLADALRIDHAAPADAARRWIAQASGWRIESTFALVGGWDPALEQAADSAYDRAQSPDFAGYANVYRHWVLNEDGRFSAAPYDRGEPFDLSAFFDDVRVRPQPLRFRRCVTLDDTGARRRPVVEVSTDDGMTWSQYGGKVLISQDRAAVYLDDDTLPASFLEAAKNGSAQVRVTASMQNPHPVERVRWRGNAFAGEREPRVLSVGSAFGFQRVAEQSVHYEAVASGELSARQMDQSRALEAWLAERMREADERAGALSDGHGRVELAGAWPWLRIGDRLIETGGPGRRATGEAAAVGEPGVMVHTLEVHFGVGAHAGPRTIAYVRF